MPAKKKTTGKKAVPEKKVTKAAPAGEGMKRFQSAESQWRWSRQAFEAGKKIGFVPTMGAFHDGHLALIKKSVSQNDLTVVSIFVNPLQFGEGEDCSAYPHDLARDTDLARELGVDAIFIPEPSEMYPEGFSTRISIGALGERLCGAFRPGHFDGVCTVVMKLIGIVQPHRIYFGEKDAQQLYIMRRMLSDLALHVKVVAVAIKREKDGLAMSSRNSLLTDPDRALAPKLYEALRIAQKAILLENQRDPDELKSRMKTHILESGRFEIDYVAMVDPETLDERPLLTGRTLIAVAAHLGETRLIDNILINVPGGQLAAGMGNLSK